MKFKYLFVLSGALIANQTSFAQLFDTGVIDAGSVDSAATAIAVGTDGRPRFCYVEAGGAPEYINKLIYALFVDNRLVKRTVESAKNETIGKQCSLAVDRYGNPHISYVHYHGGNAVVKYATTVYGEFGVWNTEAIHQAQGGVAHTSIAVDSQGRPSISYYLSSLGEVYCARKEPTRWNRDTIAPAGSGGGYTSIAIDGSGAQHITFFDSVKGQVLYARRESSGAYNRDLIETGLLKQTESGFGPAWTSVAVESSGVPIVSYYHNGQKSLKFARKPVASGTWSERSTIDGGGTGGAGAYHSLAVDSTGAAHVCYRYRESDREYLKYARRPTGSSVWSKELVHHWFAIYCDLALDAQNQPHISYCDYRNADLLYASRPATVAVTVTFLSIKVVDTVTPNSPADLHFDLFGSTASRRYPTTGDTAFPSGQTVNLPANFTVTRTITRGSLFWVKARTELDAVFIRFNPKTGDPIFYERPLEVYRTYVAADNYGAGVHTERSNIEDVNPTQTGGEGYFDITYRIDVRDEYTPPVPRMLQRRPSLTAAKAGPNVEISWQGAGYEVETATELTGPWINIGAPSSTNGIDFMLTVDPVDQRRFYRLISAP